MHLAQRPVLGDLGDRAGDDVEPLVGEDERLVEVDQRVGQPGPTGGAEPVDLVGQPVGTLDDVDAGEPQVGPDGVKVGEELAAPAPEVEDAAYTRMVGERPDGQREHPAEVAVGRGEEVAGGALGPTVEAGGAVERVLPGLVPGRGAGGTHGDRLCRGPWGPAGR